MSQPAHWDDLRDLIVRFASIGHRVPKKYRCFWKLAASALVCLHEELTGIGFQLRQEKGAK